MANNRQSDVTVGMGEARTGGGSFTLTATDDDGEKGMQEIYVHVTDENLNIGAADKAVTVSGTAREGRVLTASFDETKDPDLAGDASAELVVYTWSGVDNPDTPEDESGVRQKGVSNRYTLKATDVGAKIMVSVSYYEMVPGASGALELANNPQSGGPAAMTGEVSNSQSPGQVHFEILTNEDLTGLTAAGTSITDWDDVPADGEAGAPKYMWESSVNGRGGWTEAGTGQTLSLADGDGEGLYYRVVVDYTDGEDAQERHVSGKIKVGKLGDPSPDTPSGTGQTVVGGHYCPV